jgi:NADH dehydrogenase
MVRIFLVNALNIRGLSFLTLLIRDKAMQASYETKQEKGIVISNLKKNEKIRILVLGSGFAGMSFVRSFIKNISDELCNKIELIIVTKKAYHLFTPLLYQVATGLVNEYHILDPIRNKNKKINYEVIEAEVLDIDLIQKIVITNSFEIPYDYLIIALGSVTNYFGIKGASEYAIPLKNPEDAIKIRNKIIESFEKASLLEKNNKERRLLLTFVIIGGGPSGVELAGSIKDYLRQLCKKYYPIDPKETRVIVVEAMNRLLPQAREKTSEKCKKSLEKAGIEILLNTKVLAIEEDGVITNEGVKIESYNVFWTAGIKSNPIVERLPEELIPKKKGKIIVDEYFRLPSFQNVFAIGDNAWISNKSKTDPVPAMASAAVQEGKYLGEYLANLLSNKSNLKPFKYKDFGMMFSLGRFDGLVEFPNGLVISGFLGWIIWRMVHLVKIATIRNKLGVMFDWTMSLFKRRIITRV